MKFLLYIFLFMGALLIACNDEPTFPDPGLDTTRDVYDTVRRDTIDTYYIEMHVKTMYPVKKIEILNGLNYQLIEEINQYNGQRDFMFRHPIDLKPINLDKDTTMNYIVKVVDKDDRSYNKAFALTVKPFSAPTITVSGVDGTLGLVNSVFELNVHFETGFHKIHSYKLSFEDEVLDEKMMGDSLSEYYYSYVCNLQMEKERDYKLNIQLTDDQGNSRDKTIILRLIELQKPIKVIRNTISSGNAKLNRELEFHYNPTNPEQLDSISGIIYSNIERPYTLRFEYDDKGRVVLLEEWSIEGDNEWQLSNSFSYEYDDNGRLLKAIGKNDDYNVICTDWYDDGRVKRWAFRKDMPVTNEAAWQISDSGEYMLAEKWSVTGKRALGTQFSAVAIPTYLPSLPSFFPYTPGVTYEEVKMLLFERYGVNVIHEYNENLGLNFDEYDSLTPRYTFGYVTNINGRLEKITKRELSRYGDWAVAGEYIFVYKD